MTIDVSTIARVTGVKATFKDLREGSILYLPQRIAVLAQGNSDIAYSLTKFTALTDADVGAKMGYGCPAHVAMLQLQPRNGDGVGSVPVDIYPLPQLAGSQAATGDITPSGTQSQSATYRVRIGGINSAPFVAKANASVSDILGAAMMAILAVLEMPVNVAPAYGTVTSSNSSNTGNGTLASLSVSGSPRPGTYKLVATSATVFRLVDPDGVVVNTNVPVNGTPQTVSGVQFTLTAGATPFAAGDTFTVIVQATKLNVTTKWKGASANATRIVIEGDSYGVTWAFTQPAGGAGNPLLDGALAQFGSVWETLVLNALNISDTVALDTLHTFNEGRWDDTVRKPFVSFVGTTHAAPVDATAVSSQRRLDRTNVALPSPGSDELPFMVAARQLARIARIANNNPPCGYGGQQATGLRPGPDGVQWDFNAREFAAQNGCSTVEVKDNVVCVSDVVTFYRPTGEPNPGFRFVVDIVKLQNIIFNIALIFESDNWADKPLIPDAQPVKNPDARKPRDAIAAANAMIDSLGDYAILSDPAVAKSRTRAGINGQNAKRLDLRLTVYLSGNTNQKSVDLGFGFYYGAQAAA